MLLDYQKTNLAKLEESLVDNDYVCIVGSPKSGRKKVVSMLPYKNKLIINILPSKKRYTNYDDFLNSVKGISYFNKTRKKIGVDLSLAGNTVGISMQLSSHDLFSIENEIVKRLIRLSRFKRIIFVVENPELIDEGTQSVLSSVLKKKRTLFSKRNMIRIDICETEDQANGKVLYFENLSRDPSEFLRTLYLLNLNPNIQLSEYILDFICRNANGNIDLINKIIDDINKQNIDVDFNSTDQNSYIRELVCTAIEASAYKNELTDILTIISLCDRYFNDLDLSFLVEKDLNLVELYLNFAVKHKLLENGENGYYIVLGIIRKIFSNSPIEKKRVIYNRILKLINTFYPDQYLERYNLAKYANQNGHSVYLQQHLMKDIRETGRFTSSEDLNAFERKVVDIYYSAYCKASSNQYDAAAKMLTDFMMESALVSPIKQEYQLLISQCLIKSIDIRDRNEAIALLAYDSSDTRIDDYLRYRLETRKIAALIHNGDYKAARIQSKMTTDRLLESIVHTKSPGSAYYLNVIYRKYCNIHPYESSLAAIKKSVSFFAENKKYVRAYYIALNNEFALELINGQLAEAQSTYQKIKDVKETNFSIRFPRQELLENNSLILRIMHNGFSADTSIIDCFSALRKTTKSADHILVSSNLAVAYALSGHIEEAVKILTDEFNAMQRTMDSEGIYSYRIICNLAILQFIRDNSQRENSIKLLKTINIPKDDPHYHERSKEYNLFIETMDQIKACASVTEWMESYRSRVDVPRNYFCLYECGFVFTTLFDWDDE